MDSTNYRKDYRIQKGQQKTTIVSRRDDSSKQQLQTQTQKSYPTNDSEKIKKENEQLKSELIAAKEQIKYLFDENKALQTKVQHLQDLQFRQYNSQFRMALDMQRQMRNQQYYEFMQEAMMPQQQFQTDGMTYEQILELEEQIGQVSKGLTKEQIKKIPKRTTYCKLKDRCTICFNDIEKLEKIRELKCKHLYHSKCIKKWLENQKKCPICQTEVI